MVGVSGDEHKLETGVRCPEPPGGFHAVQHMKFHIQKNDIQLTGVMVVPAKQGFPGREFKELPLYFPAFQNAFQ